MEWIDIKDKLPKDNGSYLVSDKKGTMAVASYDNGEDFWEQGFRLYAEQWRLEDNIQYWQPLPKAPK
jgi:hypothetical protein